MQAAVPTAGIADRYPLRKLSRAALRALYALLMCLDASIAAAQGIPIIRDTEIEKLLEDYARSGRVDGDC